MLSNYKYVKIMQVIFINNFSFSFFRKLENIECKKVDTKNIISTANTEKPSLEKDPLCRTLFTNTTTKSSQPLQIENCIKSKCKIDNVHNKPNTQRLSTVDSSNTINPQLPSEQYINIFNRYQVF